MPEIQQAVLWSVKQVQTYSLISNYYIFGSTFSDYWGDRSLTAN